MKQFDLSKLGVQELNEQELLTIEGGSIFSKAWNGIKAAGEFIGDCAEYAWYKLQKWANEQDNSLPSPDSGL
ncbi:MAG: hypothetical protein LBT43_00805 [Prevotella sp.]|jgi:hypothetical protein|nr:hypothetical protein [Prevotella sp.]